MNYKKMLGVLIVAAALVPAPGAGLLGIIPPDNDDFADATAITSLPFTDESDTEAATTEEGEPVPRCTRIYHTVWYRYTATHDTVLRAVAPSNGYSNAIAAYTGSSLSDLIELDCGRVYFYNGGNSQMVFRVEAGKDYYIQAGHYRSDTEGPVTLQLYDRGPGHANDQFADAVDLGTLPVAVSETSLDSTTEIGEPTPSCESGTLEGSLWYKTTLPASKVLAIDVTTRLYQSFVAAYTGSSVSDLTQIGCEESGSSGRVLHATAPAGTTVYIQLGIIVGWGSSGTSQLEMTVSLEDAVANDRFADAHAITALPFSQTLDTTGALRESGEPRPSCIYASARWGSSVWYELTPSTVGTLVIDTDPSDYRAFTAVYTGSSLSDLAELACGGDSRGGTEVRIVTTAGQKYFIQIAGRTPTCCWDPHDHYGLLDLLVELAPAPAYDEPAGAIEITSLPFDMTTNNRFATNHDIYNRCGVWGHANTWYKYTAPQREVLAATSGIAMFEGSSSGPYDCFSWYRPEWAVDAGKTYYFMVTGSSTAQPFHLESRAPPVNDDFVGAITIPTATYSHAQDTLGASIEAGETLPTCASATDAGSVWYSYTAPSHGRLRLEAPGPFGTFIGVYTGSSPADLVQRACRERIQDQIGHAYVDPRMTAGSTFHFQVGSNYDRAGDGFNLEFVAAPANDAFAQATRVGPLPFQDAVDTFAATRQGSESKLCMDSTATVWYEWRAPSNMQASVDTIGSDFDTVLGVFTGPSLSNLVMVACDDNSAGQQSELSFLATEGRTYYIQAGGDGGRTGNLVLNVAKDPLRP